MPRPASLSSLPILPEPWEVVMFPAPFEVEGVPLDGMMIVAEASGLLRLCAPVPTGTPVADVLRDAFLSPSKGTVPGRPSGIRLSDPGLRAQIAGLLREAGVLASVVKDLPAAMEAVTSLLTTMGGPQAPGLTEQLDAWRAALTDLVALAPWRQLTDDVRFVFRGGGLDGAVAVVIGYAGQNRGVVLYPTMADVDSFLQMVRGGGHGGFRMFSVLVEPSRELSEGERAACRKARLVFAGPLHAKAYATSAEGFRAPDAGEQLALLRAVQGVVGACRGRLPGLAAGAESTVPVAVEGGNVEVRAGRGVRPAGGEPASRRRPGGSGGAVRPAASSAGEPASGATAPPRLTDQDHTVLCSVLRVGEPGKPAHTPALVVKMGKADAVRLAPTFSAIRSLTMRPGPGAVSVTVELDGGAVRTLIDQELGEQAAFLDKHLSADEVALVLAAGGATRLSVRSQDMMVRITVPVRRA